MTQDEFYQRTGLVVPAEYFETIHEIYMEAGDNTDKDRFCEEWKKSPLNSICWGLHYTIRDMKTKQATLSERAKELEQRESDLADFLLERAQKFGDKELLLKSIDLIGHAEVIRRKLAADLPFWKEDLDYIRKNIK